LQQGELVLAEHALGHVPGHQAHLGGKRDAAGELERGAARLGRDQVRLAQEAAQDGGGGRRRRAPARGPSRATTTPTRTATSTATAPPCVRDSSR
jgi:hypothetical protein